MSKQWITQLLGNYPSEDGHRNNLSLRYPSVNDKKKKKTTCVTDNQMWQMFFTYIRARVRVYIWGKICHICHTLKQVVDIKTKNCLRTQAVFFVVLRGVYLFHTNRYKTPYIGIKNDFKTHFPLLLWVIIRYRCQMLPRSFSHFLDDFKASKLPIKPLHLIIYSRECVETELVHFFTIFFTFFSKLFGFTLSGDKGWIFYVCCQPVEICAGIFLDYL